MDIITDALKIVDASVPTKRSTSTFHESSFIYKVTNENINLYRELLVKANKILSVIGSGDQIIESLIERPKHIDCFDISVYPEYFLNLKMASILSLSKDEFIDFILEAPSTTKDDVYDDYYFEKVRNNLSKKYQEFWDALFNHADWYDIYNSALFSREDYSESVILSRLNYLKNDNYDKIKNNLLNSTFSYNTGSILDIYKDYINEYDLIYLSNICQYVNMNDYLEMLKNLPLSKDGKSLTYVYKVINATKTYFNEEENTYITSKEGPAVILHR